MEILALKKVSGRLADNKIRGMGSTVLLQHYCEVDLFFEHKYVTLYSS
jgi:hypothetical protein